jgi:Tfp pilus assembly protein PilF
MPACRLPVQLPWVVCLCATALGCITQQTKTDGSFTTGGPSQYGQAAAAGEAAAKPSKAKKTDADYNPSTRLQLALAQFQEQRGERVEARKAYEKVLATDAKSTDAIIGLARLDQVAGRTADAEAGFQKAIQMDPRSGRALDALGQFYTDQKRWNDALPLLQRAHTTDPGDKTIAFHYAIALATLGQFDQAVPLLVEAVGSAAAHYNIGLILHDRGQLAASHEQFVAAILENPRMEQAQTWANKVQGEMDQVQHAGAQEFSGGMPSSQRTAVPAQDPVFAQRSFPGLRQPPAQSAGASDSGPAPQLTAPVSPLAQREGLSPSAGPVQSEQWNNQR